MNSAKIRILTVPGGGGSGPDHWHTHWERKDRRIERVDQTNWNGGTSADWISTLDSVIQSSDKPVILVAHSLGNIVVAHWAEQQNSGPVVGALLVAPADVENSAWVEEGSLYERFQPIPMLELPFPSILVASTDDPYLALPRAEAIASAWNSQLEVIGPLGHIGSDEHLELWPYGQQLLKRIVATA